MLNMENGNSRAKNTAMPSWSIRLSLDANIMIRWSASSSSRKRRIWHVSQRFESSINQYIFYIHHSFWEVHTLHHYRESRMLTQSFYTVVRVKSSRIPIRAKTIVKLYFQLLLLLTVGFWLAWRLVKFNSVIGDVARGLCHVLCRKSLWQLRRPSVSVILMVWIGGSLLRTSIRVRKEYIDDVRVMALHRNAAAAVPSLSFLLSCPV